jgi:hypothetical protein
MLLSRESSSAAAIPSIAISERAVGWRLARPCVGASRIRVLATAPLGTDFPVFNTRTLRRTLNPRVRTLRKLGICRDFMPEEGLEPPTRGL